MQVSSYLVLCTWLWLNTENSCNWNYYKMSQQHFTPEPNLIKAKHKFSGVSVSTHQLESGKLTHSHWSQGGESNLVKIMSLYNIWRFLEFTKWMNERQSNKIFMDVKNIKCLLKKVCKPVKFNKILTGISSRKVLVKIKKFFK